MTNLPDAYRPCVGMMVLNDEAKVLVGKRIDSRAEAWQMPQGGIDEGEDIERAALRELREEIGTDDVTILAQSQEWLYYDLPPHLVPQLWGGKFRGQRQKWFLLHLNDIRLVDINTKHPEFSQTQWVEVAQVPELIVPFKQALYHSIVKEFWPHIQRFRQSRI